MRAFYFGSREEPIYGVYHPAAASGGSRRGAVLCYPLGVEYMQIHRAYRQLARELAGAGVDVLRFDYSGTGDSWGNGEVGSIPRWLDDVGTAVAELKDMARVDRVSLVGFRFGATLAAIYASRTSGVDGLVLWDPIVTGRTYAAELRTRAAAMAPAERQDGPTGSALIVSGFGFSTGFLEELPGVDLTSLPLQPIEWAHIVSRLDPESARTLLEALADKGVEASIGFPEDDSGWSGVGGFSSSVLDREVLDAVVSRFRGEAE